VDPSKPRGNKFFERYPYSLPNLVAAVLFTIGIGTGILFLRETLETKRNAPDYGVMMGKRITVFVRKIFKISNPQEKKQLHEREPLLDHRRGTSRDEESAPKANGEIKEPEGKPSFKEILTKQTCLNLLVYTFLAFYSLAFDQVCEHIHILERLTQLLGYASVHALSAYVRRGKEKCFSPKVLRRVWHW
jgi:hypothetical protein